MGKRMAMESLSGIMAIPLLETLLIMTLKGKESINGVMEEFITDNGKIIC